MRTNVVICGFTSKYKKSQTVGKNSEKNTSLTITPFSFLLLQSTYEQKLGHKSQWIEKEWVQCNVHNALPPLTDSVTQVEGPDKIIKNQNISHKLHGTHSFMCIFGFDRHTTIVGKTDIIIT